MNNEQMSRMYAAYWGAKVQCKPFADKKRMEAGEMVGIHGCIVNVKIKGFQSIADIQIHEAKLILRRLSAITDEDAIEVAKMYGGVRLHIEGNFVQVIDKTDTLCQHYFILDGQLPTKLTDYLRPKYDCGHAEIPSLIDAGYAAEEGEVKPETL